MNDPTWPASGLFNVTPSDSTVFAREVRMLYVGTTGDVSVTTSSNDTVTFQNVPAGGHIGPFFIRKVNATNTTASDIIGYF
jgi:hypothetical protein